MHVGFCLLEVNHMKTSISRVSEYKPSLEIDLQTFLTRNHVQIVKCWRPHALVMWQIDNHVQIDWRI